MVMGPIHPSTFSFFTDKLLLAMSTFSTLPFKTNCFFPAGGVLVCADNAVARSKQSIAAAIVEIFFISTSIFVTLLNSGKETGHKNCATYQRLDGLYRVILSS